MPVMLAVANGPVSLTSADHACKNILFYKRYSIVQKFKNKQSAKVVCGFDRFRAAQIKTHRAILVMENLLVAHAFDYVVFRVNPGLTSFKDLAMVVYNSLDNN